MNKIKHAIVASIILVILFVIQFHFISFINPVKATENEVIIEENHYKYFYAQLSEEAKNIYDAMYEMYSEGQLKTGNANYDLVENGKVSEEQVNAYKKGDYSIITAVETARDAFYLDYPEVFYINMEKFTIRVTTDAENKTHIWLGTGNNDSYYLKGFSSVESVETAEAEYETALNAIVNGAKALGEEYSDEELIVKQIEYVHAEVIKSATYKLDDVCQIKNRGHIRTPYGALVAHEAVCEGYSKAMKVALDKLGIPCVLIRGVYKHGNSRIEGHMWTYVQVSGKWYAVDATFDDPDKRDETGEIQVSKAFFLMGYSLMSNGHRENTIMSSPEFEFKYPDLEYDNYGVESIASIDGLEIKYSSLEHQGSTVSVIDVSYKGMNFEDSKNAGYHFINRYYDENNKPTSWTYMDTKLYPSMLIDGEKSFEIVISACPYMEIAVIDIPIDERAYSNDPSESAKYQKFAGDSSQFLAYSGVLEMPDAQYTPPPRIVSASPYISSNLKAGKTTHITVTYDKDLKKKNENIEPTCYISTINAWTSSAETNSKIENFVWDGDKTVEFDFTPSSQYADNTVFYFFNIDGLVSVDNGKLVTPAHYFVDHSFGCIYSMARAHAWRTYGRPTLIDDGSTDVEGWKLKDGSKISAEDAEKFKDITDRMALVVERTSKEQEEKMNSLVAEKTTTKVLSSETYNICLMLCNKQILSTSDGDKVTVYLGFPEGYGPDDEGVTFKAYHFKTENGAPIEAEEISCVVTQYGLLVTCDAFSPFEVVAIETPEDEPTDKTKTAVITTDLNGSIVGLNNNIVEFNENDSKTYTIQANEGYQIEMLTVLGTEISDAVGKESHQITVNYNDITEKNNIINVSFVAKTVAEAEEERGETLVVPVTSGFEMKIETNKQEVTPGEIFEVNVSLENLINVQEGLIALAGRLNIDTSVLEIYKAENNEDALIGENGWDLSAFNDENFKFIADNNQLITEKSNIFTVYFKVKDNITKEQLTQIELSDVSASGGNEIVLPIHAVSKTIQVVMAKDKAESITSEKYAIDEETKIISKIDPNTTVAQFKANTTTEQTIVFTNANGKVLGNTDIISTGTKIKVGKTLNYTLSVIGDIDGNGEITINDLAQLKLCLIDLNDLTGVYAISADIDEENGIDVNDLAQLKLKLIE